MYMACAVYIADVANDWIGLVRNGQVLDCYTQSDGIEISKIVLDCFLVVLETPKQKGGPGR
jgi:hypothetical protein